MTSDGGDERVRSVQNECRSRWLHTFCAMGESYAQVCERLLAVVVIF